jgi:hypothetical protein
MAQPPASKDYALGNFLSNENEGLKRATITDCKNLMASVNLLEHITFIT